MADDAQHLTQVKRIVLVLSGKGGVGKSTVSCQMALSLALAGHRVGILDVDICGPSVPKILGVEGAEVQQTAQGWVPVPVPLEGDRKGHLSTISIGFMVGPDDAIVWRGPRKNAMIKQFFTDVLWGVLDYLIIDTPPGTSDEHVATVANLMPFNPSGAVMVTTPQVFTSGRVRPTDCLLSASMKSKPGLRAVRDVSVDDVKKELDFCNKAGLRVLGIVENMSGFVCPHCEECTYIFSKGGGEKLAQSQNITFLGRVPIDPQLAECEDEGKSFTSAYVGSQSAVALQSVIQGVVGSIVTAETAQ